MVLTTRTISVKDGGITNDMLGGSIINSKLVNDGITIGSTDTSLGDTINNCWINRFRFNRR